ncbi:Hypothetical_protein [Hexamita inflata]|uniref:Hypothetical_protein n=1 Tax=Hexamita inflata TaxID=28002 RepID=A0AA86QI62_9EUKA|nr:Hypothetical protein HINF_LOCUS694 [Hexamita inflata]CAI9956751.1 Hypothetical protein HINF_LOCUS44396 [Hexamita inflata]
MIIIDIIIFRNPTFTRACHTGGDSNGIKNAQQNNCYKNPRLTTKRTNCILKKSDPIKSQTRQLIYDTIPRFKHTVQTLTKQGTTQTQQHAISNECVIYSISVYFDRQTDNFQQLHLNITYSLFTLSALPRPPEPVQQQPPPPEPTRSGL